MDETYKEQLKEHLKFLMDELSKAYHTCDFDEFDNFDELSEVDSITSVDLILDLFVGKLLKLVELS